MKLLNLFRRAPTTSDAARALSVAGHAKRRAKVLTKAQQMRVELGMQPSPALEVRA